MIGSKASAKWSFDNPDRIQIGKSGEIQIMHKTFNDKQGTGLSAYHGIGWLEGYVEIINQAIQKKLDKEFRHYPTLEESLSSLELLLK